MLAQPLQPQLPELAFIVRRQDSHGPRPQGLSGSSTQAPEGASGTANSVRGILGAPPTLRASVPLFTEESSGEPGVHGGTGIAAAVRPNIIYSGQVYDGYEVIPEGWPDGYDYG